jgi:predicted lipid-binding transport protein (Tim44 family)
MGALLGSLFSGSMGGMGSILLLLIGGLVIFAIVRALAARRAPMADKPMQFAGIGGAVAPTDMNPAGGAAPVASLGQEAPPVSEATLPPGFEKEPFLRVAKTSFIRLQAANDARDLDDIRDYTTPEMFAELSMQIRERGDAAQKTEVVLLEAQLIEAVVEADYAIVSVRFYGLIREEASANPDSFDEVWHVRKSLKDPKATWLIAGIQQSS